MSVIVFYCSNGPLCIWINLQQRRNFSERLQIEFLSRFRFTAVKKGNNNYGDFLFQVDGVRKAIVEESDFSWEIPQGLATVLLYLTAGQVVQVENIQSTTVYGTDTKFGYLVS